MLVWPEFPYSWDNGAFVRVLGQLELFDGDSVARGILERRVDLWLASESGLEEQNRKLKLARKPVRGLISIIRWL